MLSELSEHLAVNGAAIVGVAALAFRDQLKLRLLLMVSTALTILTVLISQPLLWDSLFWGVVTLLINLWVTVQIVLDRTHIGLTDDEEQLFSAFGSLTPGEFRRLLRLAHWRTAEIPTVLTREGSVPDRLYYVLEGEIEILKGGSRGVIAPRTFIGEIAFIRGTTASATVTVGPQTRFIEWRTGPLALLLDRHAHMKVAVTRLLSADMAVKVSRAATG
jgi:hypothetical protein